MSPLYIGSYLIFVDCLLLFFLWVVTSCVLICLVLLMDGFPSLIFIYRAFLHLNWDEKLPGHQLAKLLASPTVSPIWIFSKSQGDDLYG